MELADKSKCTGCGACKAACPKQAILFKEDEEGFPSPVIDTENCIECGLCNRVCPALHPVETQSIKDAYAAQLLDRQALADSTSGGVFTAIAREIFRRNGIVYGCVWDEHYNAVIVKAESEEEIKPMRGSKYVWSWAGDAYPEIKRFLETGKTVLFTGLPCQVAGLKSFLGKRYENLYMLDFLCSGKPSPLVFHSWLDSISPNSKPGDLNLKFRDKNPYGCGVHITYNGQGGTRNHNMEHLTNPYYYAFYSHLIDQRSCYTCPWCSHQRVSDITASDYWGIQNYHPEMDIQAGVSALLVNSEKGKELLELAKGELLLTPTRKENVAKANNLRCDGQRRNRAIPINRNAFFRELVLHGWPSAEKKYLHDRRRMNLLLKNWIGYGINRVSPTFAKTLKKILK